MNTSVAGSDIYFGDAASIVNATVGNGNYSSVHVLCDQNTYAHCWPKINNASELSGSNVIVIEPGESNKTLTTCRKVWNALVDNGADRNSLFISLGGGVVTDLGGFCASTFMRGMHFAHVPTTLMGQTDAAIGGKQGVDFGKLKNYLGVISAPGFIVVDTTFLQTLPERELRNGFAETIKHAIIGDRDFLQEIADLALDTIPGNTELVARSIKVKQSFVEGDVHDRGQRASLNFGHTIGHAIESAAMGTKSPLLHGESVALGMLAEASISVEQCGLPENDYNKISELITAHFGDVSAKGLDAEEVVKLLGKDKKRQGKDVKFALLEAIGRPLTGQVVPAGLIKATIDGLLR